MAIIDAWYELEVRANKTRLNFDDWVIEKVKSYDWKSVQDIQLEYPGNREHLADTCYFLLTLNIMMGNVKCPVQTIRSR